MLIFSTKAHGILDYLMGIFLLLVPTFLHLKIDSAEGFILYNTAGFLLLYTALTAYELGVIKLIPMKLHLTLDIFLGIFLATVPWVLNFEDQARIPFVILGVIQIVAGLTTASDVVTPEPQIEKLGTQPRRRRFHQNSQIIVPSQDALGQKSHRTTIKATASKSDRKVLRKALES